jgi:hypothetical protein
MTSHSKVNNHDSSSAPFGPPNVCSNDPTPTHSSAKYEPRTCPHTKIIIQPTLHSLYHIAPEKYALAHIFHGTLILLLQRAAPISVVTEASHVKLLRNVSPLSAVSQFILDFQKTVPLRKYFP